MGIETIYLAIAQLTCRPGELHQRVSPKNLRVSQQPVGPGLLIEDGAMLIESYL